MAKNRLTLESNGYISGKQISDNIKRRMQLIERVIDRVCSQLSIMPRGKLLVSQNQGYSRFHFIDGAKGAKKEYLHKGDLRIPVLTNKKYLEKVLKRARAEKKRLQTFLDKSGSYFEDSQQEIPDVIKEHIVSFVQNDEAFINNWTTERSDILQKYQENKIYETERGDMVRSKSEVIVANMLYRSKIPYKYEKRLILPDKGFVYPDFTVLDISSRQEVYIELFGMMGDTDYCRDALLKINRYADNGIVIGDRLLPVFESAEVPLEIHTVNAIIERLKRREAA
ncbi:MAG: hypothetical protein J5950_06725 [Clostridia bacterium]|nr:hypothetical protein [Clostridia bacterium]